MIQGFNIILICYFINIVLINTFLYYLFSKLRNLDSKFLNLQSISESIKRHDNNNYKNVEELLKNISTSLDKLEVRIETRLSNLENRFNQIETRLDNLENKNKKDISKVVKKIRKISNH